MDSVKEARVVALRCTIPAEPGLPTRTSQAALIELTTESGLKGWGEVQPGGRAPAATDAILRQVKPLLIGRDPAHHRLILKELAPAIYSWGRRGLPISVLGGIETALLDVHARQLGVPFYQLLGGAARDRLRAYASGGQDQRPERARREMEGYMRAGFTAVKVRFGEDPAEGIKFVSLVRGIIGDKMDLIVDCGQQYKAKPWSLPLAMRVARELEPFNLLWLEDPYILNDLEGLRKLRQSCRIPISGGESLVTFWEARELIDSQAIDVFQPDVSVIGGPTEHRRASDYACAHGIPVADHTWGTGVSVMANIHAQFVAENVLAAEMPVLPNPIREVFLPGPLVREGHVPLPSGPGLGVELTPEIEAAYGNDWQATSA